MLKIAICDDEPACQNTTQQILKDWSKEYNTTVTLYSFDNGDDLLHDTQKQDFDIVFLDIMMPLLNGIETARELRKLSRTLKIFFLTSASEFALESYSVKADGFVLKPITQEPIFDLLNDYIQMQTQEPESVVLKTILGYQKVYLHNIEAAEAQNKHVLVYLRSGKTIDVIEPLSKIETELVCQNGFFKCHRSYIVYLPNIDFFNSTEITTFSGHIIPIARGLSKSFRELYFAYMFQNK